MIQNPATILLVAKPGRRRDSLEALVLSMQQIESVAKADDASSALETIMARPPALMLMDYSMLGDEIGMILKEAKCKRPQIRCLVLANTPWQHQMAKDAGADSVLRIGFPAAKFFSVIEGLLTNDR